ncbi:hypothetical protein V6N13_010512 [Hibiscus sabdariffa]|uniref:Uncharacterized protein n=2 Tax=Hibiscus sabdariffa TaxID=183260 RepID=A0ABR2NW20_9ROSI
MDTRISHRSTSSNRSGFIPVPVATCISTTFPVSISPFPKSNASGDGMAQVHLLPLLDHILVSWTHQLKAISGYTAMTTMLSGTPEVGFTEKSALESDACQVPSSGSTIDIVAFTRLMRWLFFFLATDIMNQSNSEKTITLMELHSFL